jgi:hypothetical protein
MIVLPGSVPDPPTSTGDIEFNVRSRYGSKIQGGVHRVFARDFVAPECFQNDSRVVRLPGFMVALLFFRAQVFHAV